jgi:zinc and cadmium transporter
MSVLPAILIATAAGGLLSAGIAAVFGQFARPGWVPVMVSFAIGTLLSAAFFGVLPEAIELAGRIETVAGSVLAGVLLFFLLEKLVIWRHCHEETCGTPGTNAEDGLGHSHGHNHDHGRSGIMITIGDTLHNFVDGVLLAAAFLADYHLGVVTAVAIIAHEIPQEIGDYLILLHSGFSRAKALLLNMLSGAAMVVGGIVGYFLLDSMKDWIPVVLGLAAASMIYVAMSDLIPGLHKKTELAATAQQVLLIALGIGGILLVRHLAGSA